MKRLFVILVVCSFLGCSREKPTSIRVSSGPSFTFAGGGELAQFTIYAPARGQHVAFPHPDVSSIAWQIKSSAGYFQGAQVEELRLRYVIVPSGYTQTIPAHPGVTVPLTAGVVYSFFAETANAPAADGFFYLSPTAGPIQMTIPDLCLQLQNGHQVRVKCRSGEPYQEPTDLEAMVRSNRVLK